MALLAGGVLGCGKAKVTTQSDPPGAVSSATTGARARAPLTLAYPAAPAGRWFPFQGYYWAPLSIPQMAETKKETYGYSHAGAPIAIDMTARTALAAMAQVSGPVALKGNARSFADPELRAALRKLAREHAFSLTLEDVRNDDLASLAGLDKLAMLAVMSNSVNSAGVATLPPLPGLQGLRLDAFPGYDLTTEAVDALARLPALRHLDIKALQIGDDEMQQLARLGGLATLDLSTSRLTVEGFKSLGTLANLDVLVLNKADVPMGALAHLTGLGLRAIDLEQTWIESDVILPLAELETLEVLNLASTRARTLPALSSWPKLRALDLSATEITEAALAGLEALAELEVLDLGHTKLTAGVLPRLGRKPKLHSLSLSGVKLSDDELAGLAACCKSLVSLDLGHVSTVGARALAAIGTLTNLEVLDLEEASISDVELQHLAGLTKLRRLTLRKTQITDKSLEVLRGLPNLTWIDVSYSKVESKAGGFAEGVKFQNFN